MSAEIPSETREEAALICAICASSSMRAFDVFWMLDARPSAYELANAAIDEGWWNLPLEDASIWFAEAEALLRTGWTP